MAPSTRARHALQAARPNSKNTFFRSALAAPSPSAREVCHLSAPRSLKCGWVPGAVGMMCFSPPSHATRVSPAATGALVVVVNPLHLDETCWAPVCETAGRSPADGRGRPVSTASPSLWSDVEHALFALEIAFERGIHSPGVFIEASCSTLSARRMASSPPRGPWCRRCPRSPVRPSAPSPRTRVAESLERPRIPGTRHSWR